MVFVLHRSEDQVLVLAFLRNFFQDLFVLLDVGRSPDDQRYVDGAQDFFNHGGGVRRSGVLAVGIRAFQLKGDHFGTVCVDALFRPCNGIRQNV